MNGSRTTLDLGVIGNCEVSGLIDSFGRLVWACLPRPDGDPAFCALLDAAGGDAHKGVFAVDLLGCRTSAQEYLRNSAIVSTRLDDGAGNVVQLTDFCPRFRQRGRMFRPMMFVRLVEPLRGRPQVRLRLTPAQNYGQTQPDLSAGGHHVSVSGPTPYRVTTDAPIAALREMRSFVLDSPIALVLGPDESLDRHPLAFARTLFNRTRDYWGEWVRSLALPFDWQDAVIRAAITLKLCTYESTGAVLAALTTSIPESPDSGRNWDYRYCWLRDSFFVVQALNRLGATRTMESYLRYISNIVERSPVAGLQPVYGLSGAARLTERELDSLTGYRGMRPVRVGNVAHGQRQHDVFGAVVLAATQLFFDSRLALPGSRGVFRRLESLGDQAFQVYDQPDAGPWELRGRVATHTLSAVMCWCACDRLARIADQLQLHERSATWRTRADRMRARVLDEAWNASRQAFVSEFAGTDLDATVLLLHDLGFVPASDPRFVSTVEAIGRELRVGDLLFRYRTIDDFGLPTHAFTTCSFWYVNALAAIGRRTEARAIFERLLAYRNSRGLLSEHIDPSTGEHWGNYPQAYSMVGVISSAMRLSRAWEEMV